MKESEIVQRVMKKLADDLGMSGLDTYDVLRRAKVFLQAFRATAPYEGFEGKDRTEELETVLNDIDELLLDDPNGLDEI